MSDAPPERDERKASRVRLGFRPVPPAARTLVRVVVPLAGLLLLAGCTAGPDGEASSSAGASLSTVAVAPPATANESPLPDNPAESVPAATSGPLSGADLPEASALGHGWVAVAEDGGVEEGPGNGTPFQQRDVAEIGEVVVPLGCEQRSGTTTPAHALQATSGDALGRVRPLDPRRRLVRRAALAAVKESTHARFRDPHRRVRGPGRRHPSRAAASPAINAVKLDSVGTTSAPNSSVRFISPSPSRADSDL